MNQKKHIIDARRCKSCGVCVEACPKKALAVGRQLNASGYEVVERDPDRCVLCNICGIVCPDVAIGVIERKTA